MIDRETIEKISITLMKNLTKEALKLEIGRFVEEDPFAADNDLKIWIIKLNERQLNERIIDLDEFSNFKISLIFVPPAFFSDVVRGQKDIPFWQVATVTRVLHLAFPVYDPESFIVQHIDAAKHLKWSPELINEKRMVVHQLLEKANHYSIKEEMLADGYMWALKAAEESICIPLMEKNFFSLTTPVLLLDTLRQIPDLYSFYLQILGIDSMTPDLCLIALKELEKLAEHLYHANNNTDRSTWILGSFVSINQVESRLNQIFKSVGNIETITLQNQFEDAIAELWQAFWLLAQTPNNFVPLDPWVVGLFWKWFVNNGSSIGFDLLISKIEQILLTGSPKTDLESGLDEMDQ